MTSGPEDGSAGNIVTWTCLQCLMACATAVHMCESGAQ